MHVGRCQYFAADLRGLDATEINDYFLRFVKQDIDKRHSGHTVFDRSRSRQHGHRTAFSYGHQPGVSGERHQTGSLMGGIALEHIECGGLYHEFILGQEHGLKHVGKLGYVGHAHTVGVRVEDVERQSCHERVAHGVLLIEVSGICSGFHFPPCAPFVN
ncbi:hypothetical protein IMSAGC021_00049 [Muribaculaceae bacterium]|nr:hypothetical protein IMSAGC021_00049 [Muribaculaceae bacterium]